MTKNLNINKISFSDFNENLLFGVNTTGSIGIVDVSKDKSNNYPLSIENIELIKYQKELNEYEKKVNEKKDQKFHFNFEGELTENQSHNNKNFDKNKNNNDNMDDLSFYFLSTEELKNKCRFYTNNNYVVFENNNGENSCYLNVFLHFLYSCKEICYFLCNLYLIDRQDNQNKIRKGYDNDKVNNSNEYNNNEVNNKEEDKNKLLILLGQILYNYNKALKNKKNKVTVLKTKKFRQFLNIFSKGKFRMNHVADTVDFINYIFEILNEQNKEETEKYFVLKLNEHYKCNKNCNNKKTTKYDNDNFIYQIYTEEILCYLQANDNINFYNKLFQFSQMIFLKDVIKCSKCGKDMNKLICCENFPKILIINCVWNEEMPNIEKLIKLYALISLRDEFKQLFQISNKKSQFYSLTHIILYSSSLSHYIIVAYDPSSKIFYLIDDNIVIEFLKLIDLIVSVTSNLLRYNEYYYYYPVLLIYSNSEKYDKDTLEKNKMNKEIYNNLINQCNQSIQEYKKRKNKNINNNFTNNSNISGTNNNNINNNNINNNNINNNNNNNNENNKINNNKSKDNIEQIATYKCNTSFTNNKNNKELTVNEENPQRKLNEVMRRNLDNNDIGKNEDNIFQSLPLIRENTNNNINQNKDDDFQKKIKDSINFKNKSFFDNVEINQNNGININNSTKNKNTNNQNNEIFANTEEKSKSKMVKSYNFTENFKK